MAISKYWLCEECKEPIKNDDDGFILVEDPRDGGYPSEATSEKNVLDGLPNSKRLGLPAGFISAADLCAPEMRVRFHACHHRCDPHPKSDPYVIDLKNASNLEAWCRWTHHLCEKSWMSKTDVEHMLAFWFAGHGGSIHG